jgi:hypothetical protein
MDRYEGPITDLTIALSGGLELAIILDCNEGPVTALNMALQAGLYLDIIMDRYKGPLHWTYYCLGQRPLHRHYTGPL